MGFNSNTPRLEFTATSGQTEFVFNFKIFETSDIVVYQTPTGQVADDATNILTETTDYTVVIDGDNGGTVTLVSGATLNDSITILRDLPYTRETDYQTGGDLLESTLDQDQDYQTYLLQQLEASKSRFINLPASAQGVSTSLPTPEGDSFIKWSADGKSLTNANSFESGGTVYTAIDLYTQAQTDALLTEKAKLWQNQSATITPSADSDYTLTASQNKYGRLVLTDGSWTAGHNIIVDTTERSFLVDNSSGTYTATVKTSAGTGIAVSAGAKVWLLCDGTNVIESIDMTTELPSVTGTATFTKLTNNINLTGIGSLSGLEVGDVFSISKTTAEQNDGEFTVSVITDANNVIVNQAHAGGTTTKSLIDETSTAGVTISILTKWYTAPIGLGQGLVDVTLIRSVSTTYPNNTNRTIKLLPSQGSSIASYDVGFTVFINEEEFYLSHYSNMALNKTIELTIPKDGTYRIEATVWPVTWQELR